MWDDDESANEDDDADSHTGSGGKKVGSRGQNVSDHNSLASSLALATQLGFSVACPMVVFIGGGAWLGNRLGWGPWLLLVGVVLGIASAGALFFQIAKMPAARRRKIDSSLQGVPYKVEEPRKPKVQDLGTPPTDKIDGNGH
jgi:hypothetical protein